MRGLPHWYFVNNYTCLTLWLPSPQFKAQHESAKNEQLILPQFEHGREGDSIDEDYNNICTTGCPKNGTLWIVRNNAKFRQ